jgi:dUTP pyrophosphatase
MFTTVISGATIPTKGTLGAAGYDLYALSTHTITGGGGSVLIPTGIAVKIPSGCYARIAPRSGLALREHLAVNAGVIDQDYFPGEIGVIIYCTKNNHVYTINKGDRFAQIIIESIYEDPNEDTPAEGVTHVGFGSTGI